MAVAFRSMAESSKFPLAPCIYLPHIRQATCMKTTRAQLHHLLATQPLEQFGSVLMTLRVAVSSNAIFFVSPRVQTTLIRNHRRMPTPARNIHNTQSNQRLHPPRREMPALVPMPQLAVHAAPPREQISVAAHRRGVVASARDVGDDLPREGVREARDVLPSVVPVAESAVVAPSPGVHLSLSGEDDRVSGSAGDLFDAHSSQGVDVGGFVLIGRVPDAQLAVFAASPGIDG
mmetsp:Transcript_17357/g.29935  ORF Transcript_17357/g.29935 Transcript_17357/m.29935 type:complete len:232 (+) Transcript_17357:1145-1840(+)